MTNEFCTYEQSLALKELRFDEPCFYQYVRDLDNDGELIPIVSENNYPTIRDNNQVSSCSGGDCFAAPLYQQAFKFFREKYSLQHEIYYMDDLIMNGYVITDTSTNTELTEFIFKDNYFEFKGYTYEEAENACLDKLIEIVKTKNK